MSWEEALKNFEAFLKLEKSLSKNSITAYVRDVNQLKNFAKIKNEEINPTDITFEFLQNFIQWIHEMEMSARSQARIISGIKAFFKFLLLEELIESDPSAMLEAPKIGRKLPEVLSLEEVENIINSIDLSKQEGQRNKAIIETLYSCGLRVSELIELKISNISFDQEFIKIEGKGNKERLVPIGKKAIKEIQLYMQDRKHLTVAKEAQNILFLNRRGKKLTRVMIFTIVKRLVKAAGINKNVSPHTFRHSFATELIDRGADLRAVQQMLGHESIITTEIYTHLDREYLRDTIIQHHPRS